MNNTKEIERSELHKTIWRIANDLRSSVDGWDFSELFDDIDVNSSKLGSTVPNRNEKLVKQLDAIGDLPLCNGSSFSDNTIVLFGDAGEDA